MQTATATMSVPNPHRERMPVLRKVRGETSYVEDRVRRERALRDDPLGQMHQRGHVGDALYRAGRTIQEDHEAVGGAWPSPSDLREWVQGGRGARSGLTDYQVRAGKRMARWRAVCGHQWRVVEAVLIDKQTLVQCALRFHGSATEANRKYTGRVFRDCLAALAREMGFAP